MYEESLKKVEEAATVLPGVPVKALAGILLTARYCIDALVSAQGEPMVARDIATMVEKYSGGNSIKPENVRQILRALQSGGLPIKSARSRGYWLEDSGENPQA